MFLGDRASHVYHLLGVATCVGAAPRMTSARAEGSR